MSEAYERAIDWSGAEVESGALIVPLSGEADSDWTDSCRSVLESLEREARGGGWRGVGLVSENLLVARDVEQGAEVALRQYLETIVQRANSDVARRKQRNAEARAREDAEASASQAASERMAETFRGFADG